MTDARTLLTKKISFLKVRVSETCYQLNAITTTATTKVTSITVQSWSHGMVSLCTEGSFFDPTVGRKQ